MKRKVVTILILITVLLVACSPNKQAKPQQQQLLTKTLQGTPTEVKTVAIVFNRLYSLPELERLLENSNLELEAWRYYSGGISGTMTFETTGLSNKVLEGKTWMLNTSIDRSAYEKEIIQSEFNNVTQSMFNASTELQDLGQSLIDNIIQRKTFSNTLQNEKGIIYAMVVSGEIIEIEEIAKQAGYEGLLDYKAVQDLGGRALIPYPDFMASILEHDFAQPEITTSGLDLFDRVKQTVKEEYGIQLEKGQGQ